MAKNNARIALPLPTETFENEDTSATQQFESKVEQGTRKSNFPVLFYETTSPKIASTKNFNILSKIAAPAPREAFADTVPNARK